VVSALLAVGCASHRTESLLLGDSRQRIELTGFSFETSEQGDAKVAQFAGHRAAFEPERIVVDGQTVHSGPYRRAAVNRGKAGAVRLTVDGKSVPVQPAQTRM
jgi:hypothetical protein